MYDHYFSNFGSPRVPKDICKDTAIRHARFWRRRFLKVFPCRKKIKRQRTTIFLPILVVLVDLPSPMIPAKVQPRGILGSEGEDF